MFQWEGSQVEASNKELLEQTIVEYKHIFARHPLDIGINKNFRVKSTPKDETTVYTQTLPVPINLKEDLTVELALMLRYAIITTLHSQNTHLNLCISTKTQWQIASTCRHAKSQRANYIWLQQQ